MMPGPPGTISPSIWDSAIRIASSDDRTGMTIGTPPANADKVKTTLDRGVLYIYTHTTKLFGAAADAYFNALKS